MRSIPREQARLMFAVLRAAVDMPAATGAARSGVSAATVRKWRMGKDGGVRYPQMRTLLALAHAFGLRLELVDDPAHVRPDQRQRAAPEARPH